MKALFALNPYIWRYKWHLIAGIFLVIISNIFGIYPAQIVRASINLVGDGYHLFELFGGFAAAASLKSMIATGLLIFAGLVVLMALMRGLFLFFTRQTIIVMSRRIEYDLGNDLYQHFQSLSLSFYRRNRTGDLMARATEDMSRVRMYLGPGIMYTINTFSLFVLVVSTMLMVNPELTLYSLLPLPFLSYAIYRIQSVIQIKSDKIQQQLSKLTTFTQEIFSGIRVVKAYVQEDSTQSKFVDEAETYKEKSMGLVKVESLFYPMIIFLVGMSSVLTVWIGGEKAIEGTLTIGNIAEFLIYVNMLAWPIISVGWVTTLIQRAAASQERLNVLFQARSELKFKESEEQLTEASVVFDDVSYTYPDTGINALQHISFELKAGQKLGIVGPTGSGKSTLCHLLPRILDANFGEIKIDKTRLQDYSMAELRGNIGYAPQDVFLFSDTIHNNVAFGKPEASDQEVEQATRWASIYENIQDFPQQFDTIVGERGVTLSGGQKQRISVARAWIRKPKLLILDDVLSAVDMNTEETILRNLRSFRENNPGVSVVMTAHRISCIQDADLILVLEDGKITEKGTHESLISQDGYYKRIYEKQLLEAEEVA